jgi:hypothetical protein
VDINPYAWLSTFPILALMLAVYFQPDDNVLKRWWLDLKQLDAHVMTRISGSGPAGNAWVDRAVFWSIAAVLAAGSVASFASYSGVLAAF